jgi:hypothetical protein
MYLTLHLMYLTLHLMYLLYVGSMEGVHVVTLPYVYSLAFYVGRIQMY